MAPDSLSATTNSGTETEAQSPQMAGQAGNTGTPTNQVQSGTPSEALNGTGSVLLSPKAVDGINLNTVTSSSTQTSPEPAPQSVNYPLYGISALLFIAAAVLLYLTARPVKNTT
jgi:hypothetical protein